MMGRTKIPLAAGLLDEERAILEGLVATLPEGARVVNIGAAAGTSAVAMLRGGRDIKDFRLWSIDIEACPGEVGYVRDCGLEDGNRYEQIVGDSGQIGTEWVVPLDLVFVDDGHTYEDCKRDIDIWSPLVKRDGYLVFHDWGGHVWQGVDKAVGEWWAKALTTGWVLVGSIRTTIVFRRLI